MMVYQDQGDQWEAFWEKKDSIYQEDLSQINNQWALYEYVKFQHLDKIFPSQSGIYSLECGCGTAGVSLHFSLKGYHTTLLDKSSNALQIAKRSFTTYGQKGFLVRGDVFSLPFPDNRFQVVMSFGLLEHFINVKPLLQEMVRVLSPGGIFFADIVPRRFSVQTLGDLFFNLPLILLYTGVTFNRKKSWKWIRQMFSPEFFENRFTRQQYFNFLKEAGLVKIKIQGNNPFPRIILPPFLEKILVRILKKLLSPWQYFDQSESWFSNELWCRGWWAWAQKPRD
jgi:ubiquinone/menaquinone biosynthesis C-methylase UbiE